MSIACPLFQATKPLTSFQILRRQATILTFEPSQESWSFGGYSDQLQLLPIEILILDKSDLQLTTEWQTHGLWLALLLTGFPLMTVRYHPYARLYLYQP